jgi:hypothetical protein
MHFENAKKLARPPPEWLEPLPEEPQAAIARTQATIAAANHRRRRGEGGWTRSTGVVVAARA